MLKNKDIFILATAVFLVFGVFILLVLISVIPAKNNQTSPTPSPTQQNTNSGASNADNPQFQNQQQQEDARRSYTIGQLINLLPYSGTNFSLFYSFSTNQFTLYINPANQTAGNSEFDAFLKKNGINDRSWFSNLSLTTQKITPVP